MSVSAQNDFRGGGFNQCQGANNDGSQENDNLLNLLAGLTSFEKSYILLGKVCSINVHGFEVINLIKKLESYLTYFTRFVSAHGLFSFNRVCHPAK